MEAPSDIVNAFQCASRSGDMPMLQKLVRKFANGEGPGEVPYAKLKSHKGYGVLHFAAEAGKTVVCRFLIEKLNFDVNGTADSTGETPLFLSVLERHVHTTNFLINNGADVTKRNCKGETPLHYAAKNGSKDIVKLLISKGANLNAISDVGVPLHSAAKRGNVEVLKLLLELNADPNSTLSSFDISPLFCALSSGSIECIELLLKAGADPNRPCYLTTPLNFGVSVRDEGIIRCLLKAGADPNMPDPDSVGHTPLERAAFYGLLEGVKLLFPVTSPIPCFHDWSIHGVMQYAKSKEARTLFKSKVKEAVLLENAKGREAFKTKNYVDAVQWYTKAAEGDPTDVKILSNRSLCYTKLYIGNIALADAQKCVELEPTWAKSHYREGAAWSVLGNFTKAAESFSRALAIDPDNMDTERAYKAALAECRKLSSED